MFWKFSKFYINRLLKTSWFLVGIIPAIIDSRFFWFPEKYLSNPALQKVIPALQKAIEFKWEILFFSLLFAHIYIIYCAWKQPGNNTGIQTAVTDETLSLRQTEFANKIERVLENHNIPSSFTDRYRNGFRYLNNENIPLAASDYYGAFRQIEQTFFDRRTYGDGLNERLLDSLESGLASLKNFSDQSQDDIDKLRKIISGLENTLGSLFAYTL